MGENCKYNGKNNIIDISQLKECFELIPVCPECFGGLPIPREPPEMKIGRVYQKNGNDVTDEFIYGAEQTLYIAEEKNCVAALLKENSPSCGYGNIYDGSFSGKLISGNGITAELLNSKGIAVFGESRINTMIELYSMC